MTAFSLFVSENKIKQSTAINGNVDPKFLVPYVRVAQEKRIHERLGSDLYNKISDEIQAGTLSGNYKILVDDYIADALVHWSFYECIPFLRFKVQNGNIYSKTSETGEAMSNSDASHFREEIANTAEFYENRLVDYLCNNNNLFPEYKTNTGSDVNPSRGSAFYSGLNIGNEAPTDLDKLGGYLL
jgi:hypothetical protein